MQQVPPFGSTDPFQTSRCAGLGSLGISTGFPPGATLIPPPPATSATQGAKHYKVHANPAFANFNHLYTTAPAPSNGTPGDPDGRGSMTRIVFNTGARNDWTVDTFQNCLSAGDIVDPSSGGAAYQMNFSNNPNLNRMRYLPQLPQPMQQQMNTQYLSLAADNHSQQQQQRCYIQRPGQYQHHQGQPNSRFVRVQNNNKIRNNNNNSYRSFNNNNNNNNSRQKQQRRFINKSFQNYKPQQQQQHAPSHNNGQSDDYFNNSSSPPPPQPQQQERSSSPPPGGSSAQKIFKQERHHNNEFMSPPPTKKRSKRTSSSGTDHRSRKSSHSSSSGKLLEPKVEYDPKSLNLSYDDISENSDSSTEDSTDLREHLIRKKQFIKREPGELESDEDDDIPAPPPPPKKLSSSSRSSKRRKVSPSSPAQKKSKHSRDRESSSRRSSTKKESSSGKYSYNCHDDRGGSGSTSGEKLKTPPKKNWKHHKLNCSNCLQENYCCVEVELEDLKEKMAGVKQSLRESQDKLLEANVVSSKKQLRLQEELAQMKKQLEDQQKSEKELKTTLKSVENELSAKSAEVTKLSLISDLEKEDKKKFSADLTRTYKERLTIEVEKLRALFDVEVSKMQSFYLSSAAHIYEQPELPPPPAAQQEKVVSAGEASAGAVLDMSVNRDVNTGHREVTIQQQQQEQGYFNQQLNQVTPFAILENVMAYNALVYAQQTAAVEAMANSTQTADTSSSCSGGSAAKNNCGN